MSWMVPPTPAPFNWNPDAPMEHAWEVTHIHFNHKAGHATDGMDIRWSEKHPLDSGGSKPEYDVEANRNDPVAYLGGTMTGGLVPGIVSMRHQPWRDEETLVQLDLPNTTSST